jgi:hypothetical protein
MDQWQSLKEKKCATCGELLMNTAKKSGMGEFIYCALCKAVYQIHQAEQVQHPEYGPCVILKIELVREGTLQHIPQPALSDEDTVHMKRTIAEAFGPIQFADLLKENGNTIDTNNTDDTITKGQDNFNYDQD